MRPIVNRLLALIAGLAMIALAVVVIVEVIAHLLGADPVLVDWPAAYAWAQRTTWSDTVVMGVSLLLALIGLALVLGQLWRSKMRRLAVDSLDPATDAAITRRGLVRDMTAAVSEVDGASPQRVTVSRSRVIVRAATRGPDTDPVRDAVTTSVRRRLDGLHLRRPPQLAVKISRRP